MPRFLLVVPLLALHGALLAQADPKRPARVEILHADEWSFDERLAPGAQRLRGNVRFRHVEALMSCDSAYLYKDQRLEAFGSVQIQQGDTLSLRGDRLRYQGEQRTARVEGNVLLRNPDMELSAAAMDYDLKAKRAVYSEGARIVAHSDGSVLTSQRGVYLSDARLFQFSRNVRLEHPERRITTDTMHYATATGIASFFGGTRIVHLADSTVLQTRRGTYDTRTGQARFVRRSSVRKGGRTLEGDTLHYDRNAGQGRAWGRVVLADSAANTEARGRHGAYDERNDRSFITGMAELALRMDEDTLWLHADTLFTMAGTASDSKAMRTIVARRGVRFFKSDLQGVCDTLVYAQADSLIRMYHLPALWSGPDQITGRHIRIQLANGTPQTLHVEGEAFLLSQVDTARFDQVTGNVMTGTFLDGALDRILMEGNARTVYHAKETKDGVESVFGVNRADCSRIAVGLRKGEVSTVTFLEQPDAVLYPIDKAPLEELRMQGADWRDAERPLDRAGIFSPAGKGPLP